jgi:hypothetical protein
LTPSLRWCALLAILLVAIGGSQLHAADVECFGPQDRYDGKSISDEIAEKLWPSGFRPVAGSCHAGFLNGTIVKGDYDKVRRFFAQQKNYMNVFYLVSTGGDVDEAMSIGRLFRKFLIHTWAPDDFLGRFHLGNFGSIQPPLDRCEGAQCVCASACALIWFGGVDRTGRVGLHRPRIGDPAFKNLPPAEAAKVYRKALEDIARYLDEMEAPRPMIDAMVATDSSNIWWVDADGDHLEQPPTYAEWVEAACGHFSKQEENTLQNLLHKQSSGNLTSNDALLLKLLSDKEVTHRSCTMSLRFSHVEQFPPP